MYSSKIANATGPRRHIALFTSGVTIVYFHRLWSVDQLFGRSDPMNRLTIAYSLIAFGLFSLSWMIVFTWLGRPLNDFRFFLGIADLIIGMGMWRWFSS